MIFCLVIFVHMMLLMWEMSAMYSYRYYRYVQSGEDFLAK